MEMPRASARRMRDAGRTVASSGSMDDARTVVSGPTDERRQHRNSPATHAPHPNQAVTYLRIESGRKPEADLGAL
eukprot:3631442-Prymnesium_polylepis.2